MKSVTQLFLVCITNELSLTRAVSYLNNRELLKNLEYLQFLFIFKKKFEGRLTFFQFENLKILNQFSNLVIPRITNELLLLTRRFNYLNYPCS